VHRDVKPSNSVLSGDARAPAVKILDFGIAKALGMADGDELTRDGQVPHSPAYASPEQLRHEATLTPASDVYQLGLVAYELLAGERAYGRDEQERIRRGEWPGVPTRGSWASVPPELRRAVERALSARPEDRYPDAEAFRRGLAGEGEVTETEDYGEATLLADPVVEPPYAAAAGTRGAEEMPRLTSISVAALAAVLALWLIPRGLGDSSPGAGEAMTREERSQSESSLEERLQQPVPPEGKVAEVDVVVRDVQRAWAEGDVERLASHYADRVEFYGSMLSREEVVRSRGESVVAYPRREIEVLRTAITFPAPDRARVLLDKEWSFRGDGRRWVGAALQELVLEPEDGRWQVVEERELELRREEID
jgi:hypothetical protein